MSGSAVPTTCYAEAEPYASLEALPDAATALFAAAADDLFGSRAWYRNTLAHGMADGDTPLFVLCRSGGRAIALFPMLSRAGGRTLASLTTPYTCSNHPLLAAGADDASLRRAFLGFARFCRSAATTRIDALPADWPALHACIDAARKAGLLVRRFDHFGNWYEPVAGQTWEQYLAARPGQLRETIRRKLRRSERDPECRFELVTGLDGLEAGIEAFESVYRRSWKEAEPFPRFNAGLMRETAALGLLRLGLLHIGGQAAAAQLWVVERARATVLKLAHDEAFKPASPGTVLTALMLRQLLDRERVAEIDFGRGDDPYKAGWTGLRRQRIGLVLVNPWRPGGMVFLGRHALGRARAMLRRAAD